MSRPKITICVPTYNRSALLRVCVESLLRQSLEDFELIVSDNASTDATRDVVQSFQDRRIQYTRLEENVGPFRNMNHAIRMARGEYVCVAHDDDIYLPSFLAKEAGLLDVNSSVGVVHCAVYEIDFGGMRRRVVRAYPTTRVLEGRRLFASFLEGHNVCCSTVMVRSDLYRKLGMFDPRFLCADYHLWLRFALATDFGYVAEPLAEMRVHPVTVTSWLEPMRWYNEFMTIMNEGIGLAAEAHPPLLASTPHVLRNAARTQGRRFFVAYAAALSRGDYAAARGNLEVLDNLANDGLSKWYPRIGRLLCNRPSAALLAAVVAARRTWGRRTTRQRIHRMPG